jgi:putative phage-type endonuclease
MADNGLTVAQLEMRRSGIGASEMAAVLGVSEWRTALDVYRAKVLGETTPETPHMQRGRLLEPVVAEMYAEEVGEKLVRCTETLRSDTYPHVLATPDYYASDRIVEIKTANNRQSYKWGVPGTDQIPVDYLVQVMTQMLVTGQVRADVAVLIGGDDFRIYPVAYNEKFGELIGQRAEAFWSECVEKESPPMVDDPGSVRSYLQARYAFSKPVYLKPTAETDALAMETIAAEARLAKAEAELETIKNKWRTLLGSAEGVKGVGYKVTWKNTAPTSTVDWKGLVTSLDESVWRHRVAAHTVKRDGTRRFTFRQVKS